MLTKAASGLLRVKLSWWTYKFPPPFLNFNPCLLPQLRLFVLTSLQRFQLHWNLSQIIFNQNPTNASHRSRCLLPMDFVRLLIRFINLLRTVDSRSVPPFSTTEQEIVESYGGWTHFCASFGLKPWNDDDAEEALQIVRDFAAHRVWSDIQKFNRTKQGLEEASQNSEGDEMYHSIYRLCPRLNSSYLIMALQLAYNMHRLSHEAWPPNTIVSLYASYFLVYNVEQRKESPQCAWFYSQPFKTVITMVLSILKIVA